MASGSDSTHVARILMVEDDSHIGRIIELALPTLGLPYEFSYALSAEEALEFWDQEPFDLLLADYNLRGMNGLKLIAVLKEQGFMAPMALVTAYDSPAVSQEARELGVAAYIVKPFFTDEVIDTIRNLLSAKMRAVHDRDQP
ncbi:MAG: response regulator [Chloroflexales bacterium]|nr:response regulator [Chloroflexales bacterium]